MIRILFFQIILLCFFCCKSKPIEEKTNRNQINEIKKEIVNKQLSLDSIKYTDIDSSAVANLHPINIGTEKLYILKENVTDNTEIWKFVLTFLISLIALIISYWAIQKERSNKLLEFLSEIDKLLISEPYLWAIYDIEKPKFPLARYTEKMNEEEFRGKLKAFCYLYINNFESALLYTPMHFYFPLANRKAKKAWKGYIIQLIVESTEFRDILTESSNSYIYNSKYKEKMKEYLIIANKILPYFEAYKNDKNKKRVYEDKARNILNTCR